MNSIGGRGRGKGRGREVGVRGWGCCGASEAALPRGWLDEVAVIGDALANHFRFHEGDLTRVFDARRDARMNARIDARTPERQDAGTPDVMLYWPSEIYDYERNDYASVSHPHGEALGPGARCVCTEREKNAKSAGHTRRSFYAGSARTC